VVTATTIEVQSTVARRCEWSQPRLLVVISTTVGQLEADHWKSLDYVRLNEPKSWLDWNVLIANAAEVAVEFEPQLE
jgi:hypothetical protein